MVDRPSRNPPGRLGGDALDASAAEATGGRGQTRLAFPLGKATCDGTVGAVPSKRAAARGDAGDGTVDGWQHYKWASPEGTGLPGGLPIAPDTAYSPPARPHPKGRPAGGRGCRPTPGSCSASLLHQGRAPGQQRPDSSRRSEGRGVEGRGWNTGHWEAGCSGCRLHRRWVPGRLL